jgi:hypothetical protein
MREDASMCTVDQRVIDWLLRGDIPPVKYLTLKNLLSRSERSAAVRTARKEMNNYHVIQTILKHRQKFWGEDSHLYRNYLGGYYVRLWYLTRGAASVGFTAHHACGAEAP